MACIVSSLPNWLQAVDSFLLVLLTGATLYVLYGYAKDTKTIAEKSVEQSENAQKQVAESHRQADAATQSLELLKGQIKGERAQEVARAITALNAVQVEVSIWFSLVESGKWNVSLTKSVKLLPDDWSVAVHVAARLGLRDEVNLLGKSLAEADSYLTQYYAQPASYRDDSFIKAAKPKLEKAERSLPAIIEKYQRLEY